jgi:hypothetical protein
MESRYNTPNVFFCGALAKQNSAVEIGNFWDYFFKNAPPLVQNVDTNPFMILRGSHDQPISTHFLCYLCSLKTGMIAFLERGAGRSNIKIYISYALPCEKYLLPPFNREIHTFRKIPEVILESYPEP